ncbi:uncharacterized protein LOC120354394 [Nilaparvata lugens]|uniref:uncharacterized protein LOC120354394 n=1 Tax=Nilaparvata lugens TaxID=108931 RepID=UPI00193E33E4|nr:uncharacterized protein LOC120354394 [Nilaparvata lugens]
MSSPSTSSPSYVLPDSPPAHQHVLNYWQRKAAIAAAESSAAAPAPLEPPSPGGEIVVGDSPIQRLAPAATWAPWRAVLTTLPNNRQKQGKRKLTFEEEAEVSGDEDESIFSQTKKHAGMDENSSMLPLMKELRRREEEDEMEFVTIVNAPTPKPWIPLRELKLRTPYPIVGVREQTNIHGRRIILKIVNAGSGCEVYLPQRFASCIDAGKIQHFNKTCKNYVLLVTHKSPNWSDIKIVKQ